MYIFCYRELIDPEDRDACCYLDTRFLGSVCGPCFSHQFGMCGYGEEARPLSRSEVETVLTEEQWNDCLANGVTSDTVGLLCTPEAMEFRQYVFADEREWMMSEYGFSEDEMDEVFDYYPGGDCWDKSIIAGVDYDWNAVVEQEKWALGYDEQPYFDDAAFQADLEEDERYHALPDGRVVIYNI